MQTVQQFEKIQIEPGLWVRGLSHRPEAIQHGNTVVVEGCVMHDNDPRLPDHLREWWVRYLAPIIVDGERREGGWFRERDIEPIPHRDPRGC
jgi:hypothetical protein